MNASRFNLSALAVRERAVTLFLLIALVGAVAWAMIALARGESVNAVWFVIAALCTYVVAYRFYARLIEMKVVKPRDDIADLANEQLLALDERGRIIGANHAAFHAADGSGYDFVADWLIRLDPVNPQTAARMMSLFETWPRHDPARRAHAVAALDRIAALPGLSGNTTEMVSRIRAAGT